MYLNLVITQLLPAERPHRVHRIGRPDALRSHYIHILVGVGSSTPSGGAAAAMHGWDPRVATSVGHFFIHHGQTRQWQNFVHGLRLF